MKGRQSACAFTGHRPGKLPWKNDESDLRCVALKAKLYAAVESAIQENAEHFICGMALGCDSYCAEAVIKLKEMHGDITLEAAIPYSGQADNWGEYNRRRYERILSLCDKTTVIQESYSPSCMMRRNRYMVDRSSVLVACYDGKPGGTWNTIRYAMDKHVEVIQLPTE